MPSLLLPMIYEVMHRQKNRLHDIVVHPQDGRRFDGPTGPAPPQDGEGDTSKWLLPTRHAIAMGTVDVHVTPCARVSF